MMENINKIYGENETYRRGGVRTLEVRTLYLIPLLYKIGNNIIYKCF